MKLLTAQGTLHDTAQASGWPLSGLQSPQPVTQAWNQISLAPFAGVIQAASYRMIYRRNPWVYACAQLLARSLARLPVKTYRLTEDGGRQRVRGDLPGGRGRSDGGAELDRLLRKPNPTQSAWSLRYAAWVDRLIYGNALWTKERDGSGRVIGLWHAPWSTVTVFPGETVPVLKYRLGGSHNFRDYSPDDVLHFGRGSDPDSPIGLSPLEPLSSAIGLQDAIQRQLFAFFSNQARPSGNLKLDGANKETLEYVNQLIQELYAGPENAGKIIATSGEWEPITADPQHSAVVEILKITREEACAVYAVSPPLVGILDRAIMANVRELRDHHAREGLGPYASELEGEIGSQLLTVDQPRWRDLFVEHDFKQMLQPDPLSEADTLQKRRHMETIDEQRRAVNLPPLNIPGFSDRPWAKAGEAPLGQLPAGAAAPVGDEDDDE